MALRELDWHRLWWIIWRVSNHGRSVQDLMFFIYFSSLSWVCLFQGCWLISDPARCWIWSSDQSRPHPWWDTRPCRHWGKVLSCALEPLLQCSAEHLSPLLAWPALRSWKFQLPEIALTSQTTPVFFINESKSHLCLLVPLQVSTAMLQFWSDFFFFFFLWKLNEECKMLLI